MNIIKKKFNVLKMCFEYGWYDKIAAGFLGKRISLFTNTLKPQRYRYIMLASHGTGRNAFWHFMYAAKAYPMRKFDIASIDRICFFSWRRIYGIVCDRDLSSYQCAMKFINKLNKKVPVFCLVRDPISIIRGGINMTLANNIMGGGISVSISEVLDSYLESYNQLPHHFIFTTSPKQFEHITKELIYIDTNDLSSQNAYNTITKCCAKIGINKISEDKSFFAKKIADSLALNIEKEFNFHIDDISFDIKVVQFENTLHKKVKILKIINDDEINRKIAVCIIGKNTQSILKQINKDNKIKMQIENTINQYLLDLKNKFKLYEESKINENDVLQYFKENKHHFDQFKTLLQYEISGIQKHAPNIVESWVYYKNFLKVHNE